MVGEQGYMGVRLGPIRLAFIELGDGGLTVTCQYIAYDMRSAVASS